MAHQVYSNRHRARESSAMNGSNQSIRRVYRTGMQVTVEIPDEFAAELIPEGEDAARKLLEDHTAQAYREGRLTMEQVRRILDLPTRLHVDPFLLRYQIFDYTIEDFREDVVNLRRLRKQHA
jgi:hypothetical protein